MPLITSFANPRVAALRALHSARGRDEANAFLIEGPHLLGTALDAVVAPLAALYAPDVLERTPAGRVLAARLAAMRENGAAVLEATAEVVARACDTQTPQGVVASVARAAVDPDRLRQRRRGRNRPLVLLLDELRDPGNVGTLLRTALAADVDEVWLTSNAADWLAPKVVRAASGAHFHLPVRADLSWDEIGQRVHSAPHVHHVLLAESSGTVVYDSLDLTQRSVLIAGNEAHGPSRAAAALATARVSIPMWNGVESLNAAVAASVILFEGARQRRAREQQTEQSDQLAETERVDDPGAQRGTATD